MPKMIFADEDTILTFGKYRGRTVADIIEEDPAYLVWAHENVYWWHLEDTLYDTLKEADKQAHRNRR